MLSRVMLATGLLISLYASLGLGADQEKQWDEFPVVNPDEFKVLVETAEDPMFQHPVISVEEVAESDVDGNAGYAKWKQWPIMKMSKAEILKRIPRQVGLIHLGCPECNAGPKNTQHDFNDSSQLPRQWGHWRWSPDRPEQYHCARCGERFPENPKYPMSKVDVFRNRLGEEIECRYWLDTAKDKKGFEKRFPKYYLNSQIDYFKQRWAGKNLRNLTDAYILTGDEAFAYKAALIVDAMCDVFPHWLYMMNYAHGYKDYQPGLHMKSTYTRTSSRRGEHWAGPIGMGRAYDVFFNSDGWKKYSDEIGVDLRAKYLTHICKFIKPEMFSEGKLPDVAMDGWQQGCPGRGGIETGRLLHDPRYMRRFADHLRRIPFIVHGSDGAYFEGSGYTCLQLNPMMRMRDMNGYSDPKSYTPPEGEARIEGWWYPDGDYEEFHRKAYNVQRELALPHGGGVVYNDAGGGFPSASYIQQTAKPRSFNVMKHGLKHVVLGDGVGVDQIQTHLLFGLDSKHGHGDAMSMQVFAKGHYLVDDITYPKHRLRGMYGRVLLHNSGLIDGRDHARGPVGDGKPEFYEPRFNGLAAVRVDGENLYPGYREGVFERTLVNVTVDPKRPYVVDLFRMRGGRKFREYMLLGSYRHRAKAELSLPLTRLPGDRPLMREGALWDDAGPDEVKYEDRYGVFTNVRAAPKGKDFKLTYTLQDTWREKKDDQDRPTGQPRDLYLDPQRPAVGMVNHFLGMDGATPYLADIPRRVDKPGSTLGMEQMPQFIFRDEDMTSESQFVCVHEPFKGEPGIQKVSRLPGEDDTLAVRIDFGDGRRDLVLMAIDEKPLDFDSAGVKTDAKLAVISRAADGKMSAWMIGGTCLTAPGVSLGQDTAEFRGRIVRSFRKWDGDEFDGFEIAATPGPDGADASLPPLGDELGGAWAIVDNRGVQDEFHDKIINGGIDEWYQKYHSRSRSRVEAARAENPDSEYVLNWEADQRRWEAAKKAGAGWAFEIKEVIQKDGKTYLVTADDHGLRVEGEKQFAQELFFPNRQFGGADTTWLINTCASTVPLKNATPKTLLVDPDDLPERMKTLMPYPQDGNRYCRFIEPDDPRDSQAEVIVDATSLGAPPPADARPGILHFTGHADDEDGQAVETRYTGYSGVSEGEMRRYIFKPKGGEQHFKGLLKVPADGVYTVFFRAGGNGELIVGDKVVSPRNRYLGAPYPRVIRLKLKAGYLPVEFWSSMQGSKYWTASNEIGWEGPGFARRPMEFTDFVYSQADLEAIAAKVSVNQLGGDDEARYRGIRNSYLAALAHGGAELYLNGNLLGRTDGGRVWTHGINLRKGDVIVLKASGRGEHAGAGLAALHKGRPFFGADDCMMTSKEPATAFFTTPAYEPALSKATAAGVGSNALSDDPMESYGSKLVWPEAADTVWLKYVVEHLPE